MNKLNLVPEHAANDDAAQDAFFEGYGSHGTCLSRAQSILTSGFRVGSGGRRGVGAYFWHAQTRGCEYATKLAEYWYKAAMKKGEYANESEQECSVLWGYVRAPESEVFNLESPEFRTTLRQALQHHWSTIDAQKSDQREAMICSVHQMLIQRTEENNPHPISVVLATVTQPPKMPDDLAGYVGNPFAIIVRKLEYLEITKD